MSFSDVHSLLRRRETGSSGGAARAVHQHLKRRTLAAALASQRAWQSHSIAIPLAVAFSERRDEAHIAAVGDELGFVNVVNSLPTLSMCAQADSGSDRSAYTGRPSTTWHAHDNSVFDVCWLKVRMAVACSRAPAIARRRAGRRRRAGLRD
ncbi:hypothetical protein CLOM_g1077 [Closterium sp. NIES-68]|nr:hypothetical protein CLOM_g1077 [Closterium sp. NIES-68]GJP69964.1 hypothetical protein CLOP_g956 [Closterium sp. NIES-67]